MRASGVAVLILQSLIEQPVEVGIGTGEPGSPDSVARETWLTNSGTTDRLNDTVAGTVGNTHPGLTPP